jgi:hypothetical protein
MTDTPQVLLAHHLKTLKLPTFLREYDKMARQCAAEGVDYPRYLLRLAELELIDRERRMIERRIKAAKFPTVKSLDSFDFAAFPSLNKALVMSWRARNMSSGARTLSRSATAAPAKPTSVWGWGLQPARKACRSASRRPLPSYTS